MTTIAGTTRTAETKHRAKRQGAKPKALDGGQCTLDLSPFPGDDASTAASTVLRPAELRAETRHTITRIRRRLYNPRASSQRVITKTLGSRLVTFKYSTTQHVCSRSLVSMRAELHRTAGRRKCCSPLLLLVVDAQSPQAHNRLTAPRRHPRRASRSCPAGVCAPAATSAPHMA